MKTRRRIALFEFPVFQGVFPLVSGYLEATARCHNQIEDQFEFEKYSIPMGTPDVPQKVGAVEADLFGFSCYVWNMGLVKRLLPEVLSRCPTAHVILGGPQVINKAARYLDPRHENVMVCNGEGEHTFSNLLLQLASDSPDLTKVGGLSFYRDQTLITTSKQDRIHDLEMIPSPYLKGYLDPDKYVWAVVETNRGCPFTCTYCFWGAAINAKVHAFKIERVLEELTWLSENGVMYVLFADANFGMLQRDVEIARHLAKCRAKNGYPLGVYFSSSKNTPERVVEITRNLDAAGLIAGQPVSLQSINPEVLRNVKRHNIKTSSYTELQRVLNERKLSSFLEIIWPLPGETLTSFKEGLGHLCLLGADCFIVYPLLIINNVEMENQRDEFGLRTIHDPDPNSEAEIVVETKDVSRENYHEGLRFAYHMMSLYSMRGIRNVSRYLNANGRKSFAEVITCFGDFCRQKPEDPYVAYIEEAIISLRHYKFNSYGGVVHLILHQCREEFDHLLSTFVRTLPEWEDPELRFLFEVDLLSRPHVYLNTPVADISSRLEMIRIVSVEEGGYVLEMPESRFETVKNLFDLDLDASRPCVRVNYQNNQQYPFMEGKSMEDNWQYCNDQIHKMASIVPAWSSYQA